ncbi:hypothetical protein [Jiulongibacter sp. NS-SX5]|uniref:hypothetical protein n=1 Tax=Jiulongibacter sp. NS-SX5 TaxID=3463854 RepID=UPI004059C0E6
MNLEEQMDSILLRMENGELFALSQDTPDLFRQAIKKLLAFDLISKRGNTFDLTSNGHEAIELGGFNAWRIENKNKDIIKSLTINGDISDSQVGLSSRFGNLESSHNSTILEPTINAAQPKKEDQKTQESSILNKIYKWTDHKLISGIILLILGFFISRFFIWLGLLPCPK